MRAWLETSYKSVQGKWKQEVKYPILSFRQAKRIDIGDALKIELSISGMPDGSTTLTGFSYFWLMYVKGFKPERHCQECLAGGIDVTFQRDMEIGRTIQLEDPAKYKHIYVCGEPIKEQERAHLASLTDWRRAHYPYPGVHLALLPEEGINTSIQTYNGIHITVTNARRLEIPYLPDHFAGRDHAHTSCCIWQFGVAYYGLEG